MGCVTEGQCDTNKLPFLWNKDVVSAWSLNSTKDELLDGSPDYKSEYNNYNFYFASNENKEKFDQNPEKYHPRVGGWCTLAMGCHGE
jgi:YHS domain-containing protein